MASTTCFQTTVHYLRCRHKQNAGFTQCDKHMNSDHKCLKFDKRTLQIQRRCQKCLVFDPPRALPNHRQPGPESFTGAGVLPAFPFSPPPILGQSLQETHLTQAQAAPFGGFPYSAGSGHSGSASSSDLLHPWETTGMASAASALPTILPSSMPNNLMPSDYNMGTGVPVPELLTDDSLSHSMYTSPAGNAHFSSLNFIIPTQPESASTEMSRNNFSSPEDWSTF